MRPIIRHLHTCTGHRAAIYALANGNNPGEILSAGGDGWIVSWDSADPETGKLCASISGQIFSVLPLPSENMIVAGDMLGGLYWIDLAEPTHTKGLKHHQKGIYGICAVDTRTLLTTGGDGFLGKWNIQSQKITDSLHLSNKALRCIALHPSLRLLAIGDSNSHIFLLDADSLEIRHKIENAHANSVFSVAFSPDGHLLLSGGRDAMLRVWDLQQSNKPAISEQPAHLFTINHIAFSPNGQYFATASRDKTFKIWDAVHFTLLKVADTFKLGVHNHSVNRVLWLSDHLLATCSDDRSMMLWAIEAGE